MSVTTESGALQDFYLVQIQMSGAIDMQICSYFFGGRRQFSIAINNPTGQSPKKIMAKLCNAL
ncbi:hypothetical protein [Govanella unica]|uniref:Uncharacterized protein n=1 Tax=Govanella unica TaxID=2975056 RepID=A0A9X3Z8G6_9PROT|nr:hypothetical protein [Govania unica]MDA5195003.1 hypothetical protein [Govania unica]